MCKKAGTGSGAVSDSALRKSKALQYIGSGVAGRVFGTTYNGQKAVIKITRPRAAGTTRAQIEDEVINLKAVGQFLGWGRNADSTIFYIVMHDMGRQYQVIQSQLPLDQAESLIEQAIGRYAEEFHMENEDKNPGNFVFQRVGGVWRAEIIDWARASRQAGAHISPAGNPEVVEEYDPDDHNRACGCAIA